MRKSSDLYPFSFEKILGMGIFVCMSSSPEDPVESLSGEVNSGDGERGIVGDGNS